MRSCALVILITAITFSGAVPVRAQQDAATIVGEVTDPSRGVIPKAVITVTNVATGITTTTETNDRGLYNVPGLRPGEYIDHRGGARVQQIRANGTDFAGGAGASARCEPADGQHLRNRSKSPAPRRCWKRRHLRAAW